MNNITVKDIKEIIRDLDDDVKVSLMVQKEGWDIRRSCNTLRCRPLPYSVDDTKYLCLEARE